jgi:hypothetical protein
MLGRLLNVGLLLDLKQVCVVFGKRNRVSKGLSVRHNIVGRAY